MGSTTSGRSRQAVRPRALALGVLLTLVVGLVAAPAPVSASPTEHSGSLPNGTTWKAVVPQDWNGTLLLYSRGYYPSFLPDPNPTQVAPDGDTRQALLDLGYALVGSSYSAKGWPLETALQDQLDSLDEAVGSIGTDPDRVLAYGSSMGGLVTGQLSEQASTVIEGALATCGIVGGAVGLGNYQLDAVHAINELLAPSEDIPLVDYATMGDAFSAAGDLTAAVDDAQETPLGRARTALAASLLQIPDWRPGEDPPNPWDWEAVEQAQYEWLSSTLTFILAGRFDLETSAGGNASWNAGVDYLDLFSQSPNVQQVVGLYLEAGLTSLHLVADLIDLTNTADITADPAALDSLRDTSTLSGEPAVPVLTLHTTDDNLVPVEHEDGYFDNVLSSGNPSLVRQAYVARPGHCTFTPAEMVASIQALEHRLDEGNWDAAAWWELQAAAEALSLGDAAFLPFVPPPFLGRTEGP